MVIRPPISTTVKTLAMLVAAEVLKNKNLGTLFKSLSRVEPRSSARPKPESSKNRIAKRATFILFFL